MLVQKYLVCVFIAVATAGLAGCRADVNREDVGPGDEVSVRSVEFGEAERRAAKLLSIGNLGTSPTNEDPAVRALVCADAITAIMSKLSESRVLTGAQLSAIEEAARIYRDRALEGGVLAAANSGDRLAEQDETDGQAQDEGLQARIAIGCLRDFDI
ncbi:hypothetical protein [Altererythrobacter sp. Z27]|uniref:hypothetical protein n=1 Tax=Altererythrobacter sp. Z27 TaxID=3461147 RepID=UPI004044F2E5